MTSFIHKSKVKQSKVHLPPLSSPPKRREEGGEKLDAADAGGRGGGSLFGPSEVETVTAPKGKRSRAAHVLTQADIDALSPPDDGVDRNFSGLMENLRLYKIPFKQQYAIITMSNYGAKYGPIWVALGELRAARNIRMPGLFLISCLRHK
jgi:hypothetical protein